MSWDAALSCLGGTYLPKGHGIILDVAVIDFHGLLAVISYNHGQIWVIHTKTPEHDHELVGTEESFGGNRHQVSELPLWARKDGVRALCLEVPHCVGLRCSGAFSMP